MSLTPSTWTPLEIALWTLLCFPICLLILVAVYKLLHVPYKSKR